MIEEIGQLCEEYLENIISYNELENFDYSNIDSSEKVLKILKSNTEKKHTIYHRQGQLMDTLMETLLDENTVFSEKTYEGLKNFANKMAQSVVDLDLASAFQIYKWLLSYGEKTKNYDIIIEETYWCGICEWKYYKMNHKKGDCTYFNKMKEYAEVYPLLSKPIRRYYIAGNINRILWYTDKEAAPLLEKGREILNLLEEIERDYPDTPVNFDAYRSVIYRNMTTAVNSFRKNIDNTEENTAYVCKIAKENMKLIDTKNDTTIPFDTVYYYDLYTAQFHAGEMNLQQFLECLDKLCVPDERCSEKENYNRIFYNNARYIEYLKLYAKDKEEITNQKILRRVEHVLQYFSHIKRSEESFAINNYIFQFVENVIGIIPYKSLREFLFRTMASQHKDTCVHNLMVEKIMSILTETVLEEYPEELIGVMGYHSVEEIKEHKKDILQMARDMALMHDIGKYRCMNIISNASRKLSEEEFAVIKKHPVYGYELIKDSTLSSAIQDGVLLHHKWYNGKGGYPSEYSWTENKPLVDILCVSDCLEAATDPYGRSYSNPKSLDDMIQEFDAECGTRYAAFVIRVLKKSKVKLKMQYLLKNQREKIVVYVVQKNYPKILTYYFGKNNKKKEIKNQVINI